MHQRGKQSNKSSWSLTDSGWINTRLTGDVQAEASGRYVHESTTLSRHVRIFTIILMIRFTTISSSCLYFISFPWNILTSSLTPCFYSQQPAVTFSHWTLLTCSSLCRDVSMRPDIVRCRPLWFSAPDETSSQHQSVLSEPTRDVRLNSHLSLSAVSAWTHANKTRPRRKPQEQNMFRPSSVCSEPTEASPSNTGEHGLLAVIDPASCDWSDLWLFCC